LPGFGGGGACWDICFRERPPQCVGRHYPLSVWKRWPSNERNAAVSLEAWSKWLSSRTKCVHPSIPAFAPRQHLLSSFSSSQSISIKQLKNGGYYHVRYAPEEGENYPYISVWSLFSMGQKINMIIIRGTLLFCELTDFSLKFQCISEFRFLLAPERARSRCGYSRSRNGRG
jgi:hypothetical protein